MHYTASSRLPIVIKNIENHTHHANFNLSMTFFISVTIVTSYLFLNYSLAPIWASLCQYSLQ